MTVKNYFFGLIFLSALFCTQTCLPKKFNLPKPKTVVPPKAVTAPENVSKAMQLNNSNNVDFKNFSDAFNIPVSSDTKKYYSEIDKVDGWFDKRLIVILLLIDKYQEQNNIIGNLGEIGVWQGKSFIPLMHLAKSKQGELVLAADCFESVEFNRDNSGGLCAFKMFNNNVNKYCSKPDCMKVFKGDSYTCSASDYLNAVGNGKGFRIFSIDGCHEGPTTAKDMENAFNCLVDGGVIIMDDYFHWCWPGVSEGVNAYMNKNVDGLKPFLIAWNKVFFAHPQHAQKYFDTIKEVFIPQDVRAKKFFGVDTLIYDPQYQ